jgi:hypothetical protein
MERTPFLPLPEGMLIDQVQITETGLLIAVVATHDSVSMSALFRVLVVYSLHLPPMCA